MFSQPQYHDQDEHKENMVERKSLPPVLTTASGRVQGAPMSPVKINIQSEDRLQRPFTAQVEDAKSSKEQIKNGSTLEQEQYASNGSSEEGIIRDIRHRQNYTTHTAQPFHQHQVAVLSSMDNGKSSFPERGSSLASLVDEHASRESSVPSSEAPDTSEVVPDVQPLQYHHLEQDGEELGAKKVLNRDHVVSHISHDSSSSDHLASAAENERDINRHLTPTSLQARRSAIPRPASGYSALSDPDHRGRSPGHISNSPTWRAHSPAPNLMGRSPDGRRNSYVDLLNVPYHQQAPPPPINFDNSQLRTAVGSNASLLSTAKTLEMYRMNAKKTTDPSIQYAFAIFLISAAREAGLNLNEPATSSSGKVSGPGTARDLEGPYVEKLDSPSTALDLLREARQLLSKLADRSYPFAQYYLADGYASGLFNKGKEDYDRAFPLFVAASKHGHAESGYRAALCYEFGWGCRKDPAKAVQFYRQSASKNHPGAMTRLGRACLNHDLGLNKYREGITWLKRATEAADAQYNAAPYYLGLLYETGYGDDIFLDETYAAQLFTQAADLGHAEASYRLGDAYEHGKLSCPRDPALSVHFYTGAAQQGHPAAMMALCAWYMVGAEPVLEKDENEAYEWARRAAECGMSSYS
jgi:TPR repeat protein